MENLTYGEIIKILLACILASAVGIAIGFIVFGKPRKCSDQELHQIIDKVNIHKKSNAGVYDHEYGEKLISEVCK